MSLSWQKLIVKVENNFVNQTIYDKRKETRINKKTLAYSNFLIEIL